MTNIKDKFYLEEKIPIGLIQEPYCLKCMNQVEEGSDLCLNCSSQLDIVKEWYFNEVKALGIYHSYEIGNYKIPINILSEIISILKFKKGERFKKYAGNLLADGFSYIFTKNIDLFKNTVYITIPPKYNREEINQCIYLVNPFLRKLKKLGYDLESIIENTIKLKDTGTNKGKKLEERFNDIQGVHQIEIDNLHEKDVLIIDDVFTVGSTAWDLSRALKEANSGEINIIVAGRHMLFDGWPIPDLISPDKLSFEELIMYFSRLDIDREYPKIKNVKLKTLNMVDNETITSVIEGSGQDYNLHIDLKYKIVKHDCYNYVNKRAKNKKFCKHIIKAFLVIKKESGERYTTNILRKMYTHLDKWEFISD
jgi:predicted amidophosphoribosyltransferase